MKLGFWIAIIVFSSQLVFAEGPVCSDLFMNAKAKAIRKTSATVKAPASKKELNNITDAVAGFIEKNGKIPTEKQIAEELKVDQSVIKAFLAKKSSPDIAGIVAISKQSYPDVFAMYEAQFAKKAADYLEENHQLPKVKDLAAELKVSERDLIAIYGGNKDILSRISQYERKTLEKITDALTKAYVKAARAYGRSPTLEEVAQVDGSKFSVEALQSLIGKGRLVADINDLFKMAQAKNPKSLKGVIDLDIYNEQKFDNMMKDIKVGERLVVVVGIAGAEVNKDMLGALETYNKVQKAPLFVKPINNETSGLDTDLHEKKFVHVLISELELGPELKISNIPLTAKQINPLSGLNRVGKRGQSIIVGAPKAHVDVVATKENKYSHHMLMTTGSINDPNVYQGQQYISKRTDYIAEQDHFMGAIIIEKTSSDGDLVGGPGHGTFHTRHIEYIPEKKGFLDLNKFYTAEGVEEVRAEAVAFGDIHAAQTEQKLLPSIQNQILQNLKPRRVFLDDLFDGNSISHYERDKVITLSQKAESGQLNFESELEFTVDYMRALIEAAPKDTIFYVKDSNHNSWVQRYLNAGQFMKEPQNTRIGLELAQVMQTGVDPLEYYFEKSLGSKYFKRIIFLKPEESIWVGPENLDVPGAKNRQVLMSEHGDRGANGAKGGLGSFQRAADRVGYGHTHTYQRRNGTVNYGTTSLNPLPYSVGGFSNWVHGLLMVGPNGEQQVLIYKNGEWYRDASKTLPSSDEFFQPGYPYAKPNNAPTNAVQVDQYTTKRK